MKKVLLICLAVLTISCSEEFLEQQDELKVSPPNWLYGIWNNKDEMSGNKGWKFTPDEVVKIDNEGNEVSLIALYLLTAGFTGEEITLKEFEGTNSYSILVKGETFTTTYDFSRISSQEISWDNAPPLNAPEYYIKSN